MLNKPLQEQDREDLLRTSRRLLIEAQALSSRISAVNEIAIAINRTLDLDEILRVVRDQAKWLLDFQHCSVCIMEDKQDWRLLTLFGPEPQLGPAQSKAITLGIKTRRPQIIKPGPEDDPFLPGLPSQIIFPLESEGKVLGTLNFAAGSQQIYTQEDLRIGYLLALQLAAAVRNAERFKMLNRLYSELDAEKQRADQLLLNLLPAKTAHELTETGRVQPQYHEAATIMFTDFTGFTQAAQALTAQELVNELDRYFSAFDVITEKYNLEKLKTIGDSYMCAGGIPLYRPDHAIQVVQAALEMRDFVQECKTIRQTAGLPYWDVRIGINSGPVIAGVIGYKKFTYDVWGDTVNVAARLETSSLPGKINISEGTYNLVKTLFDCEPRGQIQIKGKGELAMFFVNDYLPGEL